MHEDEYNNIAQGIDGRISSIAHAMGTIIEVVFRLIYRYRPERSIFGDSPWGYALMGSVFSTRKPRGREASLKKNFPYLPAVDGSGKVFLCLNTLRRASKTPGK